MVFDPITNVSVLNETFLVFLELLAKPIAMLAKPNLVNG